MKDIKINDNLQSLNECRESIELLGKNIANDCSSTIVNDMRIRSLRTLLNLFEEYNNIMEKENNH